MDKKILKVGKRTVFLYSHANCADYPIVYTHASADTAEGIVSLLGNIKVILAAVDDIDWECDLSPWSAPRVFQGGADFMGGADAYLRELTDQIMPAVEETTGYTPCCRMIAGYSMAGLFALYALYRTGIFQRAASVSGSLWYDGFLGFMKENRPMKLPERVYFSLGNREKLTKNQRLATVHDCTAQAEKRMQDLGVSTLFERNEGNHFADVPERIVKGIRWIV